MDKRLIQYGLVIAGMVAVMACSGGTPDGGSSKSPDTGGGTNVSGSANGDTTAPPSDVANPPTVAPSAGGALCGNAKVDTDEPCDDGNTVSGDGCSSICKTESCGDGIVHSSLGEECDGTNLNNSTCATFGFSQGSLTCNSNCKFVSGCSNPAPLPTCGNAKVESGEQCDDGNTVSGDGCSSICKTESCGDGTVQSGLGEDCDGSNLNGNSCTTFGYTVGNVSCSGTCKLVKIGCSAVCGNGTKETGEGCDDGNTLSWDGCTSACKAEVAPTFESHFASDDGKWLKKSKATGSVNYGIANTKASDQKVARLIFAGSPGKGPGESSQIETKTLLGFGMYRARVSMATCAATEEAVNGIFVYSHAGDIYGTTTVPEDSNGNSIEDNNEIDFEVLCGEPRYLWMTSWTDYDETSGSAVFRKVSRVVDMATGKYYQTRPGKEGVYGYEDYVGTNLQAKISGFATSGDFYELGFDWQSTYIRFFIMIGNTEVTLWTLDNTSHPSGVSYIPQNKAAMMFNLWYTPSHWWVGGAANSPANPATLDVDWFKYWAN